MKLGLIAAFALLGLAATVSSQASPRSVVDEAATLIENNYFDATKAREIASELRKEMRGGRYDALTDSRDLASALTRRLQPLDAHFNVIWRPAPAQSPGAASAVASGAPGTVPSAAPAQSPATSPPAPDPSERRNAYGFRRVEMLPGAIGYVDLRYFADFTFAKPAEPPRQMADAALALLSGAEAVILDLRNNGGGSPAMVGYLVSAFTPPDADIYNIFHNREGTESERPKDPYAKPRLDVPLYVLISGRTGSAAEATAYTLQAARRATIVGEPSGGAANPGGEFPIGAGLTLFISTGTPINPVTRTNWEGKGVQPDVRVPAEGALERTEILALEAILAKNSPATDAAETRWILEARRAQQSAPSGPALAEYAGAYAGARISTQHNRLMLERGRRPAVALMRLQGDSFFVLDEPFRRVLFDRDSAGKINGFQYVRANGPAAWFPK